MEDKNTRPEKDKHGRAITYLPDSDEHDWKWCMCFDCEARRKLDSSLHEMTWVRH